MSRRRILGGLIATSFPAIIPARLLGANAPSNKINLAMIGTGRQAYHTNLPTLLGMDEVRVASMATSARSNASKWAWAAKFPAPETRNPCRSPPISIMTSG